MTAPSPDAQAAVLVATYQQSTQRIRDSLTALIAALWRSLGTYRNEQMTSFVEQVVPLVAGAQQQMASLTAAYLGAQQSLRVGTSFVPAAIDPAKVTGAAVRNGVTPETVYERPFHLVWRQLGEANAQRAAHQAAVDAGTPPEQLPSLPASDFVDQAVQAGLDRAVQSALTDLQLTKTHTSKQAMAEDKHVTGYRRVLEGAYSCGLCVVASTLRYHKGTLLPIHPACDCSVAPIFGDDDPGATVDDARLAAAHQAIADRFGKSSAGARVIPGTYGPGGPVQYRDVLITHEHGEIGPVLGVKGQPFLGSKDLTK